MDAAKIREHLTQHGITVHGAEPIPGSPNGDVAVFLERVLGEHQTARTILLGLPDIDDVTLDVSTPAILYIRLA